MHSGQHYDDELSAVFFRELGVPAPDHELRRRLGAGRRADRAHHARVRAGRATDAQPDIALVYGDTNTTLAGALSCARMRLPLAHVEAGMRSFDRLDAGGAQPRADRPPLRPAAVLDRGGGHEPEREGITEGVELVGDVMADVALAMAPVASADVRRAGAARAAGRPLPARDGAPCRQRGRSGGARPAGRDPAGAPAARPSSRCIPARASGSPTPATLERARAARLADPHAAAGLPGLPRAAAAGRRRGDRLGRRAEGGLPRRHPVRDAARHDRVDRDRGAGMEPAGRPRRPAGAGGAERPRAARLAARAVRRAARPRAGSSRRSSAGRAAQAPRLSGEWIRGRKPPGRSGRAGLRGPAPRARLRARRAATVVGLDADSRRAEAVNSGTSHVEDVPSGDLAEAIAAGRLRATTNYDELSRRRRDRDLRADAADREPPARPGPDGRRRHLAVPRAARGPARRAGVDDLPGHDPRAARAAARGVRARRRPRLPRRVLSGAGRPGPLRLHAAQHREGRRRADATSAPPRRAPCTSASATRCWSSPRPRRRSCRSCSRTSSAR